MSATTTRRGTIRNAGIVSIAALIGATTARAATASPDAALVRACEEMLALQKKISALFDGRNTITDEERTEPELVILYGREKELEECFYELSAPATLAGVKAMAGLALASWRMDFLGEPVAEDFDQWLALSVFEYFIDAEV